MKKIKSKPKKKKDMARNRFVMRDLIPPENRVVISEMKKMNDDELIDALCKAAEFHYVAQKFEYDLRESAFWRMMFKKYNVKDKKELIEKLTGRA